MFSAIIRKNLIFESDIKHQIITKITKIEEQSKTNNIFSNKQHRKPTAKTRIFLVFAILLAAEYKNSIQLSRFYESYIKQSPQKLEKF